MTHWLDRSGLAALAGLIAALFVAAAAMVPAEWFVATLLLVVLAMPIVLVIEPVLQQLRQRSDLPAS